MPTISFGTSNPYIDGSLQWSATSNGPSANSSNVLIAIYLKRNNYGYVSYGTLNTQVVCNGMQQNENGLYVTITENDWTLVYAKTFTVSHNNDGSKTCGVSINGNSDFSFSFSKYFELSLPKIPRYTSIAEWQVTSGTHNSLSFYWRTTDNISKIECKIDKVTHYSSDSLNTSSGSFTIGNLKEGEPYSNITIIVTRRDSGLTTPSDPISGTTSYIAPTAALSFTSSTINSISLKWSSNFPCNAIWLYNNGTEIYKAEGINQSNGTLTITPAVWAAISPGSTYSLTLKVRRTASNAQATSAAITARTLALPAISSITPATFNIGSNFTVQLSNYANNDSTLVVQTHNGSWTTLATYTVPKGTASKVISLNPSELYARCPNANTLPVSISCSSACNSKTHSSNTYNITANVANSNPTFKGFNFETNAGTNINGIIGGTTSMLTKTGNLKLMFAAACASGINAASVTRIEAKILLNKTPVATENISYSASAFTYTLTTVFSTSGNYTLQISVLDSRGNRSAIAEKSFSVYPYKKPLLDIKMNRQNDFEEITYLDLKGEISKVTILNLQKNGIISLKYRYAESGKAFSEFTELTGYNSVSGSDDNLVVSINKTTNENYFRKLDIEKSYDFEFLLTDKMFDSTIYKVFLPQGKPAFATFDNGYSVVDKVPDFNNPAKLQVGSDILLHDSAGDVTLLRDLKSRSALLKTMYLLMHPVGDILMTTSSANPGTLWGGTWVLWGSGRVPVSINTADANFNTVEKTGGTASNSFAHTHTVNNHSHGMSHTHTVNNHAHTTTAVALSVAQLPSHNHALTRNMNISSAEAWGYGLSNPSTGFENRAIIDTTAGSRVETTYNGGGLTHGHGNTGGSAPATNTGTKTATDGSAPGTSSTLGTVSNLPPYITCYMWKRTA